MKVYRIFTIISILIIISACSQGVVGEPVETVEQYINAKAKADRDAIRHLLCSEMEMEYEREANTFDGLSEVRVEGLSCQKVPGSENVNCQGKIIATYGTEDTEFPLTTYKVVQEGGEWKWCGESQ
jgi:hypothetical protein